MTIVCNTYLKSQDNRLILVEEFSNSIVDSDYVEGAIALEVNGKKLLTLEMWDYVDQLWAYLINGLVDLEGGKDEFSSYFPDQPIEISMKLDRQRDLLSFSVGDVKTVVNYQYFKNELIQFGDQFFSKLQSLKNADQQSCSYELGRIEKLKSGTNC